MKLNKVTKLSLGILIALPISFIVGNDILANHLTERFDDELSSNNLLACGGGGGGSSPAQKAAKEKTKIKSKLNFKKRKLSQLAAEGESTTKLEAEIAELEALLLLAK